MKARPARRSTIRPSKAAIVAAVICLVALSYRKPLRWPNFGSVQPDISRIGASIAPSYFGLTINSIGQQTPWPELEFAGVRLWGSIYWAEINPAPGVYNWAKFDAILEAADHHHVDVIFNLAYTPRWAASAKDAEPFFSRGASSPPADIKYWEDFIQAAVKRAAGRIRYWEVWNEPEDPKYYSGDVATMVRLQQRAYEIIKGIDSSLMVLTPSCTGTADGLRWQAAFLAAGGGRYADILSFHGYWDDPNAEPVVDIIRRFKDLFAANGLASKPVWDTEAGWSARVTDEDIQAAFVARSYLLQWAFGVERFYWYAYEGGGAAYGKLWDQSRGLLMPGLAYRTVQHWLVGATATSAIQRSDSVWTLRLQLRDGRGAIAVWDAAHHSTFSAPSTYDRYQDLDGLETPIVNGAVEIGPKPILLLAQPGSRD